MTKPNVGDAITWVIGTEPEGEAIGPVRTGRVYAVYPEGTKPYWSPFLMAILEREDVMSELLNGPCRIAVALNNPTIEVIRRYGKATKHSSL